MSELKDDSDEYKIRFIHTDRSGLHMLEALQFHPAHFNVNKSSHVFDFDLLRTDMPYKFFISCEDSKLLNKTFIFEF